jgi:hypothetical protein
MRGRESRLRSPDVIFKGGRMSKVDGLLLEHFPSRWRSDVPVDVGLGFFVGWLICEFLRWRVASDLLIAIHRSGYQILSAGFDW